MLAAAGLLVTSCQNRPGEVLNRKKMERLMYDVYVAEATMENDYQNFNTPEKKEAYINEVFRAHGVTQARWDTSLSWYSDRIDVYLRMNDSVKARLKREQAAIDLLVTQQNMQQQYDPSLYSASYIPPYYSFGTPGARNGFRFRLDSTEIASEIAGDRFVFAFNVIGIPPTLRPGLSAMLALVYGDTTIYHYRQITENRSYRIPAEKQIENDTLTALNGFVHLQVPTGSTPRVQLHGIYLGSERVDSAALMPDTVQPDDILLDTARVNLLPLDPVPSDISPEDSLPPRDVSRGSIRVRPDRILQDSVPSRY